LGVGRSVATREETMRHGTCVHRRVICAFSYDNHMRQAKNRPAMIKKRPIEPSHQRPEDEGGFWLCDMGFGGEV